jgi:hypothetical protein
LIPTLEKLKPNPPLKRNGHEEFLKLEIFFSRCRLAVNRYWLSTDVVDPLPSSIKLAPYVPDRLSSKGEIFIVSRVYQGQNEDK